MAKNYRILNVDSKSVSVATGGAAPDPIIIDGNYPVGDNAILELWVSINGTLTKTESVAGTALVTSNLVDFVEFRTEKHGVIINSLDGLGLKRVLQLLHKTAVPETNVATGTGTSPFRIDFRIPMGFLDQVRPKDSIIDLFKSRPQLKVKLKAPTALISGGTYSALSYTATVRATVVALPGPIPVEDHPGQDGVFPHYDKKIFTLTATGNRLAFEMPYNDRIYRGMYIQQLRDDVEVNDLVTKLSLVKNSLAEENRDVDVLSLLALAKSLYQQETYPTGIIPVEFNLEGKITEHLNALDQNVGTLQLLLDIVLGSGTTRQLAVYTIAFKRIPDEAKRLLQPAA